MNKTFLFFAALLMLFCGAATVVTAYRLSRPTHATDAEIAAEVPAWPGVPEDELLKEYSLTERSGKKFDSRELDGHVHVASFFFVSCPSTCRAQNEMMRTLHQQFGSQGVRLLSISVDPKNDTPERLAEYATLFNAHPTDWLFLTGDLAYTRRIGAEMYQMYVDESVHMNRVAVVDKWGSVRGKFSWQDVIEVGKMNKLIASLLKETKPPKSEETATPRNTEAEADDETETDDETEDGQPDEKPVDGKAESPS